MRYDKFFTKLFCQPLLLESGYRVGLEMALISLMRGQAPPMDFAMRKVDPDRQQTRSDQLLELRGDTAVIHIDGAIDKNLSWMDRLCLDATDLNDVNAAIARIANDRTITKVMFQIDSPGGSLPGVPETAARVAALSKTKSTAAYFGGLGCSAAYWIAGQCDQVFASNSSVVGSIGVYMALLDQSRQLEDMGIRIDALQDGSLKLAGAPWKPLGESERAYLQEHVNQVGAMFRGAIGKARPQVDRTAMEGQAFLGPAAEAEGLVDALLDDIEQAIGEM